MRDREYIKNKIKEKIIKLSQEEKDNLIAKYLHYMKKGNKFNL